MTAMKTATSRLIVSFVLGLGLLTTACGSDTPTTPTTPALPTTEAFSDTLGVQGSSFYSFTVAATGQVSLTLASLVPTQPGPAVNTVMGLGVGSPSGTDCSVTNSVTTAPGLVAQLVSSQSAGTYCAKIYDVGGLTGPVNFTVRIVHP
jgi:hypothetical protein